MSLINPSIRQTKRRYVRRWRGKTFVLYQKLGVMSSKDGPAPPIQVTSRKQMLQLYGAPQPISTMTADDILKSIASDEDKPLRDDEYKSSKTVAEDLEFAIKCSRASQEGDAS